jgi:hypothetical protein
MKKEQPIRPGVKLKTLDRLAWYLDSSIRIPGTKWTVGLDGLLGFIPGIGDLTSGAISSYIVLQAIKRGIPAVVIAKMLINIGLDTIVGAIPVVGDLFDIAFKANHRNVKLIHNYENKPSQTRQKSQFSLAVFLLIAAGSLALIFWLTFFVLSSLFHLIF